jgi:hypothetical protein
MVSSSVLHLEFAPKITVPDDVDLSIKQEDIRMAQDIGILTPREQDFYKIPDSDRVFSDPPSSSTGWVAQSKKRPEYKAEQEKKKKKYSQLIDDIEFIQLQEQQEGEGDPEHVAMLDDLADLWEADLDGTVFVPEEPFGHKACRKEIMPQSASEIVRITIKKPGFYIGSIAGQPANVFIPRDITKEELNSHSYYFMNLRFNPCGRNLWTAVVVGKKIPSSAMKIGTSDNTVTYKIPTPNYLIGAIIGKDGRNINNLCQSVKSWYGFTGEVPDFTIKSVSNTHSEVLVHLSDECTEWGYSEIEYVVDHMHF